MLIAPLNPYPKITLRLEMVLDEKYFVEAVFKSCADPRERIQDEVTKAYSRVYVDHTLIPGNPLKSS